MKFARLEAHLFALNDFGSSVFRNARELQMEKIQLELENQTMEKKFREFQSTWNKGKEEMKWVNVQSFFKKHKKHNHP